jgi:hypothetical protein
MPTPSAPDRAYALECANAVFKAYQLRDHARANGLKLWTGLLPASDPLLPPSDPLSPEDRPHDFRLFKTAFKRASERVFRWNPDVPCFGVIERNVEGEQVGCLHCHLLMALPPRLQAESERLGFASELREAWGEAHLRFFKSERPGDCKMNLTRPRSDIAREFVGYIGKQYNRGPYPAKWGVPRRFSWLVSANMPDLWTRDELPSRWRKSQRDPVLWLREQFREPQAA